jgi:hypothetical protein
VKLFDDAHDKKTFLIACVAAAYSVALFISGLLIGASNCG